MKLSELLRDVDVISIEGSSEVEVARVTADSRQATSGSLFVAVPGYVRDGAEFIAAAVSKGAAAVIAEKKVATGAATMVHVSDARAALALVAAASLGHPARSLRLVGVTGTSGKTTTTKMVESIFDATGEPVGLIGTIEYRAGEERELADRTTPDAVVLQNWFRRMVDANVSLAVMEVSSHALSLKRTHGVEFAAAVFTNLSREHLDFHKDLDDYFAAKKILFSQIDRSRRNAVVNIDDEYGSRLAGELGTSLLTFGRSAEADIRPAPGFSVSVDGLHGIVHTPAGDVRVESTLIGVPNLYNWLGAIGAAVAVDVPIDVIEKGITALRSVRGRFERVVVPEVKGPTVLVDYAHKPDALEKLLVTTREIAAGRPVWVVFGCGGDRDRGKRPVMGEIAARLADVTIVTSDNPRSEKPEAIIAEIREGFGAHPNADLRVIEDRRLAIEQAVATAPADAVIVVAGKGHENYQVVGDDIVHFDDREEVELALQKRVMKT
jgi:UDP-N-acetylmuramoyl-L-alanyl-D-glutamate--2,6-diaminopimelate ligase